ncbi:PAS-domain containing protein [Rubrivivax benzoatilyticus]|uniref:PAS-domain containing protein n=1 Tax=Rubrivivax benzoatilyticus TaxID=316997 RepID=UPI00020A4A35|nr:PAS-domain containing protein [Rubrivivax benzoatilyticus]EGJ09524.1 signal transduction histidine kinase [Rubrivivax benzoatilyticus JA2 = ATCC BAA-35]
MRSPKPAEHEKDAEIEREVHLSQVAEHASAVPFSVLGSAGVATFVAWALHGDVPDGALLGWLAVLALLLAGRLWALSRHRRCAPDPEVQAPWLTRFRAGTVLNGCVWGGAALMPMADTHHGLTVLMIAVAGMSTAALVLAQFDRLAGVLFALPAVTPVTLRLLTENQPPAPSVLLGIAVAALLGLYGLVSAERNWRQRLALATARRQEQRSLVAARDSEALLRLIYDHVDEGLLVAGPDLRVRAMNPRFAEITRLDPALGRPGTPVRALLEAQMRAGRLGGGDPEATIERWLALLRGGGHATTVRVMPDGRTVELRRNATPDGGFVAVAVDITQRLAAEAALAEKQRMLALLLDSTTQGFWFVDNALRTTDANPAMCRMLGLRLEALRGRTVWEFVDEDQAVILREQVRRREAGEVGHYELRLRRDDGTPLWCMNQATPILDAQGRKTGAIGLFSDIGELRRATELQQRTSRLLEEKSRLLEATLANLPQGVLTLDEQGRAAAWNRRLVELTGVPEELLRTHPTLNEFARWQVDHGGVGPAPGELDPTAREPIEAALRGDLDALPASYQRTGADGRTLQVATYRSDGGPVVRTFTDITDALHAEQALRESESRFRSLADAAPALVVVCAPDGRPEWVNQRWQAFTGSGVEQALAEPWHARVHADDQAACIAAFEAARPEARSFSAEYRLRRADGGWGWIADTCVPRRTPGGGLEGWIRYGWDITARKAAEAALIAARDDAERANRAKSDFLSRMSHELRTPLNAVLGFGQLLESDAAEPLTPLQRQRLQQVLRGGRHLLAMIDQVLDLAGIDGGTLGVRLEAVPAAAAVAEACRLVAPLAAERGVRLEPPAVAVEGFVLADAARLRQVLAGLLTNAVKYNRRGGRVSIAWRDEGEHLRLEVHDDGPGIAPADQRRVFQAFERLEGAHAASDGAGVGLALAKWLVEAMHGRIGLDSAPGRGSTFWVRLERSSADASGPPAPQRRTLLYVEDNAVNQMLMEAMLARRPELELLLADDAESGLALALAARPALVLLDIQLPDADGFELLRRMRARPETQAIPVVAVSADAMPDRIAAAREAGFADYLTKPLEQRRLLEAIDRALDAG